MKVFAFLLSWMIMLLPLMPCGDNQECTDSTGSIAVTAHSDEEHNDAEENCTPFCCCACCPASVFTPLDQPLVLEIPTIINTPASFHAGFYSHDFHAIWQPPKIG